MEKEFKMKRFSAITILTVAISIVTAVSASSGDHSEKLIMVAANKVKTIKHKVHANDCEQKRKEINNRCRYHHKMGKSFCDDQDAKNAGVCADLQRKAAAYKAEQENKAAKNEKNHETFAECIAKSNCDTIKDNEAATKACYEHCHKASGF